MVTIVISGNKYSDNDNTDAKLYGANCDDESERDGDDIGNDK